MGYHQDSFMYKNTNHPQRLFCNKTLQQLYNNYSNSVNSVVYMFTCNPNFERMKVRQLGLHLEYCKVY